MEEGRRDHRIRLRNTDTEVSTLVGQTQGDLKWTETTPRRVIKLTHLM